MNSIKTEIVSWPVAGQFRISSSTLTEITVVVVTITLGQHTGRGECRPYPRYNETPESVCAQIRSLESGIDTLTVNTLQNRLPAGAARNAADCALWDLKAQIESKSVSEMIGLPPPRPRNTAYTLSLDTPNGMSKAALAASDYPLLKMKIGSADGLEAALAVMEARPDARLIIDANEALDVAALRLFQDTLMDAPIALIEQPLPAGQAMDKDTASKRPIICADEALHTRGDLTELWAAGYRAVNIKLDKAGGLTEGLALAQTAKEMGFTIMIGCMVGSSLAMAPALLLESFADIIDLDGALLLADDHENGMVYEKDQISPAPKSLWGHPRGGT